MNAVFVCLILIRAVLLNNKLINQLIWKLMTCRRSLSYLILCQKFKLLSPRSLRSKKKV